MSALYPMAGFSRFWNWLTKQLLADKVSGGVTSEAYRPARRFCYGTLPGYREGDSNGSPPARKTALFETRQTLTNQILRLGRLLAAYDCPVKVDTEAINARVGGRERAPRTRCGDRACASTRDSCLVIQRAGPPVGSRLRLTRIARQGLFPCAKRLRNRAAGQHPASARTPSGKEIRQPAEAERLSRKC